MSFSADDKPKVALCGRRTPLSLSCSPVTENGMVPWRKAPALVISSILRGLFSFTFNNLWAGHNDVVLANQWWTLLFYWWCKHKCKLLSRSCPPRDIRGTKTGLGVGGSETFHGYLLLIVENCHCKGLPWFGRTSKDGSWESFKEMLASYRCDSGKRGPQAAQRWGDS